MLQLLLCYRWHIQPSPRSIKNFFSEKFAYMIKKQYFCGVKVMKLRKLIYLFVSCWAVVLLSCSAKGLMKWRIDGMVD